MASENTIGREVEGILRGDSHCSLNSDSTGVSFEKVLKLDFHK